MYRKPKFLEVLHALREEMSREADYDVELFAEMVRSGMRPEYGPERNVRGFKSRAPRAVADDDDASANKASKKVSPNPRRKRTISG